MKPNSIEVDDPQSVVVRNDKIARVGGAVPIPLDLVEMGLPEDLEAEVVAIEPCPALQPGPGRVVLTTVDHLNRYLFDLAFVTPAGASESVRTTGYHKFYRQQGAAWVSAVDLHPGDTLQGIDGPLTVESLTRVPGTHRVYNLTVEGEHVYRVSTLGALVHNNCPEDLPFGMRDRGSRLGQEQGREFRPDQLEIYEFDKNQPKHVRGWLANERRRVESGRADIPRTPPGYVQGHGRLTPAREGYDYSNSRLQGEDLNKLEEAIRRREGIP